MHFISDYHNRVVKLLYKYIVDNIFLIQYNYIMNNYRHANVLY